MGFLRKSPEEKAQKREERDDNLRYHAKKAIVDLAMLPLGAGIVAGGRLLLTGEYTDYSKDLGKLFSDSVLGLGLIKYGGFFGRVGEKAIYALDSPVEYLSSRIDLSGRAARRRVVSEEKTSQFRMKLKESQPPEQPSEPSGESVPRPSSFPPREEVPVPTQNRRKTPKVSSN